MLPSMPGLLILFTFFGAGSAGFVSQAEQTQPVPPVRYHLCDDPSSGAHWADPNFDDSSWTIAQNGRWPVPAFYSDGFVWVRVRVPVRSDASGPLAVHIILKAPNRGDYPLAIAAFVNGQPVSQQGSFPPHAEVNLSAWDFVSSLAGGLAMPGTTAVVVLRVWYPPLGRGPHFFASAGSDIDESRNLHLAVRANHLATLLAIGPDLTLNIFIASMGVGLLVFWRWTGSRELLFCSAMLIVTPPFEIFTELMALGLVATSWRIGSLVETMMGVAGMAVTIEFIWAVQGLKFLGLKRLAQAAFVIANGTLLFLKLAAVPSPLSYGRPWRSSPRFCFSLLSGSASISGLSFSLKAIGLSPPRFC